MLIKSTFQADMNNCEIFPKEFSNLSFICMTTELEHYHDRFFPWHWHSALEIDFIAEGNIEFLTADASFHLKKGDAVFFNSSVMHAYHAENKNPCKLYALIFDMHFLSGIYNSLFEEKYMYPILKNRNLSAVPLQPDSFQNIHMIEKIVQMIELATSEPYGYEFTIRSLLSEFWCILLKETRDFHTTYAPQTSTDIDRIKIMMQFIHEHYMEKLSLKQIADSANISTRECNRCFQRCIHATPINYLTSYRVHIASQMLLHTSDSITAISENCGFSSASYFGKVFQEALGQTPFEYRNHAKK